MSQSNNTTDQPIASQQAAGQQAAPSDTPAALFTTAGTLEATNAPLIARGQRVGARSVQQHHSGTQPMAIVENGREVEGERDPSKASEWEKLVATAALRLVGEDLGVIQERIARVNGSTSEDIDVARYLLILPLRAKGVEQEEVAIAQKRGWCRG